MSYQTPIPTSQGTSVPHSSLPVLEARQITGEEGTALIVLDDKTYILRITRAGKLILTK